MLDQTIRSSILTLREAGHGTRVIARALHISRNAVKAVLAESVAAPPPIVRAEKAEAHRDEILELYASCKGNLVRVHEELVTRGHTTLSYQALTAFCRRHGIGHEPPKPAGHYHFEPGQEMQHDTSSHVAHIGGAERNVQTASLVLCHSRMVFMQLYPRFTRFHCKVFLTEAVQYIGGACTHCMIDNTHVVVLRGTGKEMVPVPEMEAFASRLGFRFIAHAKGDANRSAHVERQFDHIENNFLAGRKFTDFADANRQAYAWCDKVNASFKKHLHARPRELFAVEQPRRGELAAATRVFVYGTLLAGERNHRLLKTARLVGSDATLPRYELRHLGGFPGLVRGGTRSIGGELYEVDAPTLFGLDKLEGHPDFYRRTRIRLVSGIIADTYLLRRDQVEGRPIIESNHWRTRAEES